MSRRSVAGASGRRSADSIAHLDKLGGRFNLCHESPPESVKKPIENGWQYRGHSTAEAQRHHARGRNVGLLTGDPSDRLIAIDLDAYAAEFQTRWPYLAPLRVVRENAPDRAKLIVRCVDGVPRSMKLRELRNGEPRPYLELIAQGGDPGTGGNAIIAGSYDGGEYVLIGDRPGEVTQAELAEVIEAWRTVHGDVRPPKRNAETRNATDATPGITATVPILDELDGATMARGGRKSGHNIQFRCPAHDDKKPSAGWTRKKGGQWNCRACGASGGWSDLARRLGINPDPAAATRAIVAGWRARLDEQRPFGQRRDTVTLRKVLIWFLGDCEQSGQRNRVIGCRRAADGSGIGTGTAARALNTLCQLGVLWQMIEARGHCAAVYRLQWRGDLSRTLPRSVSSLPLGEPDTEGERATERGSVPVRTDWLAHDVWRYRTGLGAAWQVCADLLQRPQTLDELRRKYARTSLNRWLDRLQQHGLIAQTDDGVWVATAAAADLDSLDRVAVEAVRIRRGERQRQQHRLQQTAWRYAGSRLTPDGDVVDPHTGEVIADGESFTDDSRDVRDTIRRVPLRVPCCDDDAIAPLRLLLTNPTNKRLHAVVAYLWTLQQQTDRPLRAAA